MGWEFAISHLDRNEITEDALLVLELISVTELESFFELMLRFRHIVLDHLVATSVVMNTNMPCLWKSVDLDLLGSIDKAKVTMAEVELAKGKLYSEDLKCEEVGCESSVVGRVILCMDELSE